MSKTTVVLQGRLVGEGLAGTNMDFNNQPMFFKTGAKKGEPRTSYYVKVAIPKDHPSWPAVKAACDGAGKEGYPALFNPDNSCKSQQFSWKYEDGDSVRLDGTDLSQKEGYPGHYVVKANAPSTAPGLYVLEGGKPVPCGLEAFKRGYYVAVEAEVEANPGSEKPGIFINLRKVLRTAFGTEIVSGKAAEEVFAGVTAPPEGTSMPVVGANVMPAPREGFHNTGAPAAPTPPPAAPTLESRLLGEMKGYPMAQLEAAGWTEATLIAAGHMSDLPY